MVSAQGPEESCQGMAIGARPHRHDTGHGAGSAIALGQRVGIEVCIRGPVQAGPQRAVSKLPASGWGQGRPGSKRINDKIKVGAFVACLELQASPPGVQAASFYAPARFDCDALRHDRIIKGGKQAGAMHPKTESALPA